MSKDLSTINKNDEAQLEAEVSKSLAEAKVEDNIVTDENGNPVVAETAEVVEKSVTTTDNSLDASGNKSSADGNAAADQSDSADGQPVKTTDSSLDASGNGPEAAHTAPNTQANAGKTPQGGTSNNANPDAPAAGTNNHVNPDAPQRGFKKGLGWLLITLEDMDEYLESPDCVGVPQEVRTAVKDAIRAMSPASAAMDEAEDAIEAVLLGKDASEVETVEKSAEANPEVAELKKSVSDLTALVQSLQKSMPVVRKGLIRNEEPATRNAVDEMRDEVKKAHNPEDALKTVLSFVHQQENGQ